MLIFYMLQFGAIYGSLFLPQDKKNYNNKKGNFNFSSHSCCFFYNSIYFSQFSVGFFLSLYVAIHVVVKKIKGLSFLTSLELTILTFITNSIAIKS